MEEMGNTQMNKICISVSSAEEYDKDCRDKIEGLLLCFLHWQVGSLPLAPHKKPVKERINLQMIVPVDGESCPLTPSFQVPVILGPFSSLLSIATAQVLWSSEEPLGRGVLWNPELM